MERPERRYSVYQWEPGIWLACTLHGHWGNVISYTQHKTWSEALSNALRRADTDRRETTS